MEEIKEKILQKRTFQRNFTVMLLTFWGRSIQVCQQLDSKVKHDLSKFPEDFAFVIGSLDSNHPLILQNRSTGLRSIHESYRRFSRKTLSASESCRPELSNMLEIRFKSVEAAWRMAVGKETVAQAYARHDIVIRGELSQTVQFLRCIERVESCLFPRIYAKHNNGKRQEELPSRYKVFLRMIHIRRKEG